VNRTIFILLDGLRYQTARDCLGFMEALVSAGEAQIYEICCELPSLSRPLYETLMTGLPPVEHGVVSNATVRLSCVPNVFSLAKAAGLKTAAAAYHWYFELNNRAPFTPQSRYIENDPGNISYGFFYWDDVYPDSHLFADADDLLRRHKPDFLLLHPMNIDDAGHKFGGASREYRNSTRRASDLLSLYLPSWREAGYSIIVTSDHGMSDDGNHGGPDVDETHVPFYTVGKEVFSFDVKQTPKQTEIAGLLCALLGIENHAMPVPYSLLKQRG